MTSWKQMILDGIDFDSYPESSFTFGAPVSSVVLSRLEEQSAMGVPSDLRDLLCEFNGLFHTYGDSDEPVLFDSDQMTRAIEYYRNWDVPTEHLLRWSRNIWYLAQCNGFACMSGIVIQPLGPFKPGEFIKFDHDDIEAAAEPDQLFRRCADDLETLIDDATIGFC